MKSYTSKAKESFSFSLQQNVLFAQTYAFNYIQQFGFSETKRQILGGICWNFFWVKTRSPKRIPVLLVK